jgi:hypothetical protein
LSIVGRRGDARRWSTVDQNAAASGITAAVCSIGISGLMLNVTHGVHGALTAASRSASSVSAMHIPPSPSARPDHS